MVEYVVLLTVVSLIAVAATVALGVPLVRWYSFQRVFMMFPIP
jgi:Flp pilus assembly pilin Flp